MRYYAIFRHQIDSQADRSSVGRQSLLSTEGNIDDVKYELQLPASVLLVHPSI